MQDVNQSDAAIRAHRRRAVSRLRLRGLTMHEIRAKLWEDGVCNVSDPDNIKAWCYGTVRNDINAIEKAWLEASVEDMAKHKANVLAEIQEVCRVAWKKTDLEIVLRGLAAERKLLGLDAPTKTALTDPSGESQYDAFAGVQEEIYSSLARIAAAGSDSRVLGESD